MKYMKKIVNRTIHLQFDEFSWQPYFESHTNYRKIAYYGISSNVGSIVFERDIITIIFPFICSKSSLSKS